MSEFLRDLGDCFEGIIPSCVATVDACGVPNVSYLSQVYRVDDDHVALSNQFFSKTAANVRATGRAAVVVVSGRTGRQHLLQLVYEASLSEGEVFDRMAAQLLAISSQHGLAEAMKLRSADLYRVVGCRKVVGPTPIDEGLAEPVAEGEHLAMAARIAAGISAQSDAEAMLDCALEGLARTFGFTHAMVLMLDDDGDRLVTLGSFGYETGGAGAEVKLGDGAIGIAAQTLRPVRLSELSRSRRFAEAVGVAADIDKTRTIPLPGLAEPNSQLAAPMIIRGRAAGVLFVESPDRFRFVPEDENALALIGAQLAASLRLAELEARESASPSGGAPLIQLQGAGFRVKYFAHDDSLFVDDVYLIKGVPGRLLLHFLQIFVETGRRDFTNREIRLEADLRLPGLKDNLETRLILLRRRLEEKQAPVRLSRPARGQIRLEIDGAPHLEIVPA